MNRLRALLGYAPWYLKDGALKAIVPIGLFAVLAGMPLVFMIRQVSLEMLRAPGRWQDNAVQVYDQMLPLSLLLGAIVLMSGAASLDRERQHVRFLFSRPVLPWAFYLMQFVANLALFIVAVTMIPLAFSALITGVPLLPVLRTAALFGLLYGALGALCGAFLNRDGIAFIGAIIVSGTIQQIDRADQLGPIMRFVADALPPIGAAGRVRGAWFADQAANAADLRLVVLYGLGMLAVALWVIHRRPLVR
jgi:ABC-type transport system involved in multi-copper enzyme maturation permease subunit